MPKFVVTTRQVFVYEQIVEADNEEHAINVARQEQLGFPVTSYYEDPTEEDVEPYVEEPVVPDPSGKRPFTVFVRHKTEFELNVLASDEEEARELAYEMPWPPLSETVIAQDVSVFEVEEDGEVVEHA